MLTYEHIEVGQTIKAYDHEPRAWVENGKFHQSDSFLVGRIEEKTVAGAWNAKVFAVRVIHDNTFKGDHNRVGEIVYVPVGLFEEYDGRVTVILNNDK